MAGVIRLRKELFTRITYFAPASPQCRAVGRALCFCVQTTSRSRFITCKRGAMIHATYWPEDDTLKVRVCDKPSAREAFESWNIHKSYAEDAELVEVVFWIRAGGIL